MCHPRTISQPRHDNNNNSCLLDRKLLGGEVKVKSGLESVEFQVAGREKSRGLGSPEEILLDGNLSDRGRSGGRGGGTEASLVTSEEPALVRSVEGVHKGIDTGAVSAGRNSKVLDLSGGLLRSEVGTVGVEPEVTVGRVMGVDEGVEVGVHGFVGVVIVNGLGDRGGLDNRGSDGLDWSLNRGGGLLSDKGGRVLSVSSRGDVGTLENPEAVLAGSVPHSDGVPVLANVAVLPNPLPVSSALLPEHGAVLLGKGSSVTAIPGIKPLLLEDLGVLGVNDTLAANGSDETSCGDKSEHDEDRWRNFLSLLAELK